MMFFHILSKRKNYKNKGCQTHLITQKNRKKAKKNKKQKSTCNQRNNIKRKNREEKGEKKGGKVRIEGASVGKRGAKSKEFP